MKLFFKYSLLFYFSILFLIVYFIADFTILNSNPKIYNYVPQDADQVIEVNTKEFIKKIGFEFFYNADYILPYIQSNVDRKSGVLEKAKSNQFGIDFTSKIIVYSEHWEDEVVWYCVLGVEDVNDFSMFAKQTDEIIHFEVVNDYVICLLSKPSKLDKVITHMVEISQQNIKSIDSKLDLSELFNDHNEINYYVTSKNNRYITGGVGQLLFNKNKIVFDGEFSTVGTYTSIAGNSELVNLDNVVSLRTTMSMFDESVAVDAINVDYKSTVFETSNSLIPMHVAPQLNVLITSDKTNYWYGLVDLIGQKKGVKIDSIKNEIYYLNQLSMSLGYDVTDERLVFSNDSMRVELPTLNAVERKVFELNMNPNYFSQDIMFVESLTNPPTMVANLKLNVFNSVMEELFTINKIENVYCTADYTVDKTKLLAKGEIKFNEKAGHSIVESLFMGVDIFNALEMFTKFE